MIILATVALIYVATKWVGEIHAFMQAEESRFAAWKEGEET